MHWYKSLVVLVVKDLHANAGDRRDASLIPGWEDSLEESMATHFNILARRIPWTEQSMGSQSRTQLKWLSTLAFKWIKINQLFIWHPLCSFLVAQTVKNLPAMQETWIWSLGWENPLKKGVVTHSSILAWRIPWTEEPGRLQFMGSQRVRHDWATNTFKGWSRTLIL